MRSIEGTIFGLLAFEKVKLYKAPVSCRDDCRVKGRLARNPLRTLWLRIPMKSPGHSEMMLPVDSDMMSPRARASLAAKLCHCLLWMVNLFWRPFRGFGEGCLQ